MIYIMGDELSAQILTNMLDNTDPEIDQREGTPTFTVMAPTADEITNVYAELQATKDSTFIVDAEGNVTMTDIELDQWAGGIFGVERKAGVKATGGVFLYADEPTPVPAGTQVFAPATINVLFETDTDVTVTPEGVSVPITAVLEGVDGNVASGDITGVTGDLEGIITVTNPTETTGGVDEESNEEYAARYLNLMRRFLRGNSNMNDYFAWATEISGIQDALVIPVWQGAGTVKVVLLSNEYRAPTEEQVQAVRENIDANRTFDTITVTTEAATEVPINITADVTLTSDLETVKAEYEAALTEHFKTLNFQEGDAVRIARTQNILLDTEGVFDFANFTQNGGTVNIPLPAGSVAVLGTVTLNEVV